MIDNTNFDDFRKWHEKNPYIFHWTVKGGVVEIISVFARMPDKKDAQKLARALRYRGMDASANYRNVSMRSRCEIGKFIQALTAVKIDWDEFKEGVSMLYFDGSKHIADKEVFLEGDIHE